MAASFRFLTQRTASNCRVYSRAATTAATTGAFKPHAWCSINHPLPRRALQTSATPTVDNEHTFTLAAKESPTPTSVSPNDPNWRHPRLGFAAADLPSLVRISLPPNTAEEDIKLLLSGAGYSNAELIMYYHIDTATNVPYCYVRLAKENEVSDAIAALSEFTLRGAKLRVEPYNSTVDNKHYQPDLAAGWLPSPSSELKTRVLRPPLTIRPRLLPALLAEQWLLLLNLPPLDETQKGGRFGMLQELYRKFYSYDVVGITSIRKHRINRNGWTCKILFGSREAAIKAKKSFVGNSFMGKKLTARTYRGGPDVHQRLWKYRKSLPKDTPEEKAGDLLEEKYKEMLVEQKKSLQRPEYPTPGSAVGLKEDTPEFA